MSQPTGPKLVTVADVVTRLLSFPGTLPILKSDADTARYTPIILTEVMAFKVQSDGVDDQGIPVYVDVPNGDGAIILAAVL